MEHIEKSRFAHVGQSAQESESIKRPSLTFMQDAMRRLWKNKVAMVCVVIILVLTAMSIFAPMVSKFDYREQHYSHTNAPMGTVSTRAARRAKAMCIISARTRLAATFSPESGWAAACR